MRTKSLDFGLYRSVLGCWGQISTFPVTLSRFDPNSLLDVSGKISIIVNGKHKV